MPDGIRCSTVLRPWITSVCPALWPPWKRTTPWAWSVSQSTTLPLPSSPHWVPTTTTFFAMAALAHCLDVPVLAALDEPPVTTQFTARGFVSGEIHDHDFAARAQLIHFLPERAIFRGIRREYA